MAVIPFAMMALAMAGGVWPCALKYNARRCPCTTYLLGSLITLQRPMYTMKQNKQTRMKTKRNEWERERNQT